ncbi:methionine adenosyltransferase [Kribbella sp. NPDC056345]|uniref:methionine adenosyltransferase n=1 Tax=Kribbella sp. NPDC056345 TaxID=3345789 RepID=UPI0035E3811E
MSVSIGQELTCDAFSSDFELVERKGVGHPDTICDAISETVSRRYSQYCLDRFGRVAHHWFDKVLLVGGEADIAFGRGTIVVPYHIVVAGKCAFAVGDAQIPVQEIAHAAAVEVLSSVLTGFDPAAHLTLELRAVDSTGPGRSSSRYRPSGPEELADPDDTPLVSNDSNILAAFSPLTELEQMVLAAERFLNGAAFKQQNPDVGWDIKVFGRRHGRTFELLVNVPFLAAHIPDRAHYDRRKKELLDKLAVVLTERFDADITIRLNVADDHDKVYLTALGSVADTGDVGVTGRGNRSNGLITPMRPMSIEAPAGKNPLDHTGKLYGLSAQAIADVLAADLDARIEVFIHTAKGSPTSEPDDVVVNVDRAVDQDEARHIHAVIDREIQRLPVRSRELITKGIELW